MRNYQRLMAFTLATSVLMTSVASTRVWADDGIRLEDNKVTVQETRQHEETIMVPQKRVVTEVVPGQRTSTDVIRDNSSDLTCKAYSNLDQQQLQAKYDDLKFKHAETWVQKPESGSIVTGAVAGAALTVVTGGLALVGAAIGGLVGGLFSWFRGGNNDEQRDLAKRARDAQYDQETLQLNCLENALNRAKRYPASSNYASTIPGQMPSGVNTSVETKPIASSSSSGSATIPSSSQVPVTNGSADGGSVACSGGPGSPCASATPDNNENDGAVRDGGSYDPYAQPASAPIEDHSVELSAGCFR